MPNGGSDCCGTCWFNRRNQGERDWQRCADDLVDPYCDIRDRAIEDPFYTYCANHPHRRPDRDRTPIGPILRYAGDGMSNDREVWVESPDSEEIRLHLLELLEEFLAGDVQEWYPIGPGVGEAVIMQLGEFREKRALEGLRRVEGKFSGGLAGLARAAVGRIEGDRGYSFGQ